MDVITEPHDPDAVNDLIEAINKERRFILIVDEGPSFIITGFGEDEELKELLEGGLKLIEAEGLGQ